MNCFIVSDDVAEFYGEYLISLQNAIDYIINQTHNIGCKCLEEFGRNPIENIRYRIKSPESMSEKLLSHGYDVNAENAVKRVHDAAGVRVITSFLDDVDVVVSLIENIEGIEIIGEKDYINHPKRNGYRSYHIICRVPSDNIGVFVEIQIRTVNMDTWASIEHRMKYKKMIVDEKPIVEELKRCADELAAVDLSLQKLSKILRAMPAENT